MQLAQINLYRSSGETVRDVHAKPVCSSGETVRDEHAKPVANCCLSVKFFFPSCRDIGEMQ